MAQGASNIRRSVSQRLAGWRRRAGRARPGRRRRREPRRHRDSGDGRRAETTVTGRCAGRFPRHSPAPPRLRRNRPARSCCRAGRAAWPSAASGRETPSLSGGGQCAGPGKPRRRAGRRTRLQAVAFSCRSETAGPAAGGPRRRGGGPGQSRASGARSGSLPGRISCGRVSCGTSPIPAEPRPESEGVFMKKSWQLKAEGCCAASGRT